MQIAEVLIGYLQKELSFKNIKRLMPSIDITMNAEQENRKSFVQVNKTVFYQTLL